MIFPCKILVYCESEKGKFRCFINGISINFQIKIWFPFPSIMKYYMFLTLRDSLFNFDQSAILSSSVLMLASDVSKFDFSIDL